MFWKMFLGVAVGVPVVVGVQYALAEPRERRKMKILVKGVGRFCRSICVGLYISVDYWWTSNVMLRGMDKPIVCGRDVIVPSEGSRRHGGGSGAERRDLR